MENSRLNSKQLKRYRFYTKVVAVLDVVLATLGFFFNPFNDEVSDVPFLYWKITLTSLIFEIWMIVSINLFVATQKADPEKSVKFTNYWLIVATLAFVVFQGIIIFPLQQPLITGTSSAAAGSLLLRETRVAVPQPNKLTLFAVPAGTFGFSNSVSPPNSNSDQEVITGASGGGATPLSNIYFSTGALLYRIIATIVVVKFRSLLGMASGSGHEDWDLLGNWKEEQQHLLYPDLLTAVSSPTASSCSSSSFIKAPSCTQCGTSRGGGGSGAKEYSQEEHRYSRSTGGAGGGVGGGDVDIKFYTNQLVVLDGGDKGCLPSVHKSNEVSTRSTGGGGVGGGAAARVKRMWGGDSRGRSVRV